MVGDVIIFWVGFGTLVVLFVVLRLGFLIPRFGKWIGRKLGGDAQR